MQKGLKYVSMFAKLYGKKAQKKLHLTRVLVGGRAEAKMESGHTFRRFFLTLLLGN